jgi:hydroxyacylglutathione hydrolase
LQARAEDVAILRAEGRLTLPTRMDMELATNPFLRAGNPDIQQSLGLENVPAQEAFALLREAKNKA